MEYLVECWPLNESVNKLNENGLVIDIYREAEKSCDKFSNLKSANFLPYSMAALFAKQNKLNDCLVMNSKGGIADSTIANLFIIKNGVIITPGLDDACVNGVMRRHLLTELPVAGYEVRESSLSVNDLLTADEVFLTNAINHIRWVRQCSNKVYANEKTMEIYERLTKTIES
jgi:branched-chain amino acid aminotransferase